MIAYGAVGLLLLLVIAWGRTPAFRQLARIALFAALLALGVTALRHQTAAEFPAVRAGDALAPLPGGPDADGAESSTGTAASGSAVEDLERLALLHRGGQLTDAEFSAAKTRLMNGG